MSQQKVTEFFNTRKRVRQDDVLLHKEKRLKSCEPPVQRQYELRGAQKQQTINKENDCSKKPVVEEAPPTPTVDATATVTLTEQPVTTRASKTKSKANLDELKQRIQNLNKKLQSHTDKYSTPLTAKARQEQQQQIVEPPISNATTTPTTPKEQLKSIENVRDEQQPAFIKYKNLASKEGDIKLVLPVKYLLLFDMFKGSDTIMKFMNNRQETCTFLKLKNGVQNMTKKNFTLNNLGQIKHVYTNAYIYKQEKMYIDYKNDYHLTIAPNLIDSVSMSSEASRLTATTNDNGVHLMTPQLLLERLAYFKTKLFDMVKDLHQKFLKSIGVKIEDHEIKRWHAKFDLEALDDIKADELPLPPNELKVKSGEDLVQIAKEVYSTRVQNAINELVSTQQQQQQQQQKKVSEFVEPKPVVLKQMPVISTEEKSTETMKFTQLQEKKASNYNSLLEKIRTKEKQKELENMVRNSDKEKRLTQVEKYAECVRFLKSFYQAEKKAIIERDVVFKKMSESRVYHMTPVECEQLVKDLCTDFAHWLSMVSVRKLDYIKMDKSIELNTLLTKIDSIIQELKQ